jgi:PAS domain S-box-containing protein
VVDVVMVPFRSESADALRACADRLCELATEQRLKEIPGARQELERALESLTSQADALQLERDDARAETTRAELSLTAARQILEEGPDGYLVTDSTGVILQANRSAAQLLGVSPRFLARKPLSLFIDEADLRMFRWRVNNVHTRGPSEWPVRLRPRQGSPIVAGLSVAPFKMGEPKSDLRWFVRDITVRQRAEEFAATQEFTAQMLDSERTARAEAESARAGLELQADVGGALAESLDYVAALSRVGALVVPAAADVFVADLLVSGALEQITTACVTAPDAERLRSRRPPDPASDHPIAQAIRTGRPVLATEITSAWLESWAPSPESRELWQSIAPTTIAVVPIRSHRQIHGALTFAFGPSGRHHSPATLRVLEDIGLRTALALDTAQLFRALEAEQRHRDEFLAMLAHELRNPLAAVSNGLAALERVDPQTRVQLLQILSRQSKHLARLLNDLLDVSGVRFGRVTLERRRLDVRELARQTLDVFEASGKTAKLSVDLVSTPGRCTSSATPTGSSRSSPTSWTTRSSTRRARARSSCRSPARATTRSCASAIRGSALRPSSSRGSSRSSRVVRAIRVRSLRASAWDSPSYAIWSSSTAARCWPTAPAPARGASSSCVFPLPPTGSSAGARTLLHGKSDAASGNSCPIAHCGAGT